jgi:hypothetical protein
MANTPHKTGSPAKGLKKNTPDKRSAELLQKLKKTK